jgi:hypothetical protein
VDGDGLEFEEFAGRQHLRGGRWAHFADQEGQGEQY